MSNRSSAQTSPRGSTRGTSTAGFDLVVPGDWFRIALAPAAERTSGVRALLARQFSTLTPEQANARAGLRRQVESLMLEVTAEAQQAGALVLWLSTAPVAGAPLPISLAVAETRGAGRAFEQMWAQAVDQESLETGQMRPGAVVRRVLTRDQTPAVERLRQILTGPDEPSDPPAEAATEAAAGPEPAPGRSLVADYWLRRPDESLVHLSFSSPLTTMRDPLVGLFDSVVDTITWRGPATKPANEGGDDDAQPATPGS